MNETWTVIGTLTYSELGEYYSDYHHIVASYTTEEQASKHAELAQMFNSQHHGQKIGMTGPRHINLALQADYPINPYDAKWKLVLMGSIHSNRMPYNINYSVIEGSSPVFRHVDEYLEANGQ